MSARVTWQPSGTPPIVEIGAGDEIASGYEAFRRHAVACFSEGYCPWCGTRLSPLTDGIALGSKWERYSCTPCGATLGVMEAQGEPAVGAYVPPMARPVPEPQIIRRESW